jgi:hypothetical protein
MPEKTVKRRLQDCDAALASILPGFQTPPPTTGMARMPNVKRC